MTSSWSLLPQKTWKAASAFTKLVMKVVFQETQDGGTISSLK